MRACYLKEADLHAAHLEGAWLWGARLEKANLSFAHLDDADLRGAHFEYATMQGANLNGADARGAHFVGTKLFSPFQYAAKLKRTMLAGADFRHSDFTNSNLCGADLSQSDLRMASFRQVVVDCETLIWGKNTKIDHQTDFTGVGLGTARLPPGIRQLLEYNVRRLGWQRWYRTGLWWLRVLKRLIVWPFWLISDYGGSTLRIVSVFIALAAAFAGAYCLWPEVLTLSDAGGELRGYWHAFYFSVVTQTTLGFGDIHANPDSPVGQGLLMLQVILGYVLLGALVTRFAVLFSVGGPAGRFSPKRDR